jgi:hypothetical protein
MDGFIADNNSLLSAILDMVYFYRGAMSYERGLMLSPSERDVAMKVVNKRLEAASKMEHPVF